MRLLAEAFPWSAGRSEFAYTRGNHTSVVGARGCAMAAGAKVSVVDVVATDSTSSVGRGESKLLDDDDAERGWRVTRSHEIVPETADGVHGDRTHARERRTRRGPLDERRTPRLAQPLRVQRRVQPQRREAAADGGARVRERREGRGGIGRSASDDALVDRVRRREGVRAGPARSLRRRRARLRARRLLQNIRLSPRSRRARGEATRSGGADAEVLRRRGRRGGGRVRGLLRQAERSGGVRGRHATAHRNRGDTRGLSVPARLAEDPRRITGTGTGTKSRHPGMGIRPKTAQQTVGEAARAPNAPTRTPARSRRAASRRCSPSNIDQTALPSSSCTAGRRRS